ncbi:MAG TPA: DUF3592 domain-containing protein [Promineifilum sp.]|nr:DUF3592 domain-containing protein [Promineifilum sp.]
MSTPTDEERRANRARLGQTLTAIAALWAVVAALTIVGAWGEMQRARAAAGWATVSGAVRAVEVVPVEVRGRAPVRRPGVHVEYAYTVAGQSFTGRRVQPVERRIDPQTALGKSLLALAPGDSIPVYVNPNDPAQAVLRRDVSWRGVVNGFLLLVLAAAVGVVARGIPAGPGRVG